LTKEVKNKKFLTLFAILVLLSMLLTQDVVADQWSPTEDWGPQSEPYSPDWGRTVMFEYTDSAYNLYVSPQARFRFTWDAINTIHLLYSNNYYVPLYYTFDISTLPGDTTVSALSTSMYYTTLPYPHFDRDDDPEPQGNGYYDETEVTCLQPLAMTENTDYRFDSRFKVYRLSHDKNNLTEFQFSSQMSFYDPGSGEYDTWRFEIHKRRYYPWY